MMPLSFHDKMNTQAVSQKETNAIMQSTSFGNFWLNDDLGCKFLPRFSKQRLILLFKSWTDQRTLGVLERFK